MMGTAAQTKRHRKPVAGSVADVVRQAVVRGPSRFWTVDDFASCGLDLRTVDKALLRLRDAGELVSVRRGLFFRGIHRSWGMTHPEPADVIAALAGGPGHGPAGLSAANDLGLTTQLPGMDIVAVPGPAPRATRTVRFVTRSSRKARATAKLRPTEVAVLEVLDAWDKVIEVSPRQALDILIFLVANGTADAGRLAAGSFDEPPSARERLRVVLSGAGSPQCANLVRPANRDLTRVKALSGLAA